MNILVSFFLTICVAATVVSAKSLDVRQAQRMLNQLGYNAGPVDGAYGKKTRSALEAFYSDKAGSYDGKLDANEVADLQAALNDIRENKGFVSAPKLINGKHYSAEFMINGKYVLPLKTATSPRLGLNGRQAYEWRVALQSSLAPFYSVGDFDGDGIQDYVVTVMRYDEGVRIDTGHGFEVTKFKPSKHRSFKVFTGDKKTGWGNDWYRSGGEDITHRFIEDPKMAGIADHQLDNQAPLVADFNGDGKDDLYISAAIMVPNFDKVPGVDFFGGYHSYYLSQPDGTFKESSREMMKGKNIERKSGRYADYSHRTDVGDIDGDGDIDIVHTSLGWKGDNGYVNCMYNDGTGRMSSKVCGDQLGIQVKIADFNGDGNADLFVHSEDYHCRKAHGNMQWVSKARNTSRIVFGNGSGKFYNRNSVKFGSLGTHRMANGEELPLCSIPTIAVADVDNDGDLDIIGNAVGYLYVGGYFQVYLNDGVGNFSLGQQITIKEPNPNYSSKNWAAMEGGHGRQGYCQSMFTIELNNYGYMDFMTDGAVFQNCDGKVYINNGDGTFKDAPKWMINKHASVF